MSEVEEAADAVFIGNQIRAWRTEADVSLSRLAEECGLSVGYLSQVERGRANPSLGVIKRIVDALGKTVAELFVPLGDGNGRPVHVARRGTSPRLHYGAGSPINELLSPRANAAMEVFWVEAAVGSGSGHAHHHHDGEEFGFIVQGCMVIEIDGETHVLNEGDSVYFRSSAPHQWTSRGPDDLRAVWVITPPTF